jgi:orotidine-5'-phosphate decarboxylase
VNDPSQHLAIALDIDDLVGALRLARELRPWFATAKVGLELYSAAGPEAIQGLRDLGFRVFCDLKLHDIPTTVGRASRVLGSLGVDYVNFHAQGGLAMLRAGVDGLVEGAARSGLPAPVGLAVTVLTSDAAAPRRVIAERVALAVEAGCAGVVCAATDVADVHRQAPALLTVVPGIRPEGVGLDDQARVASPQGALAAGADILVIGRAVTRADDPVAAAKALASALS